VAIIGPNAATLPLDGHSSSAVIPSYTITPKQGLEKILGAERVRYAKGCDINTTNRSLFLEAKRLARECEVVIFVGGLDNTVEGEGYFIKGDRLTGSVDLPGVQNELIHELAAANSNMVLVVISGGPCAVNKVLNNVKGLLYACYPGQEGGRALADILVGRENPTGKLPVTVPKGDDQLRPCNTDFRNVVTEGVGYRWFDRQRLQPEFAFGFGLSYTTFEYRNLRVTPDQAPAGQVISVQADVVNTGQRAGEEVVQLYLSTGDLHPAIGMPAKQLKGFKKVGIAPGQTNRVTFTLTPNELYIFDAAAARYRVPTGSYTVRVGSSSDNLPLSAPFSLTPAGERPDLVVTNIRTVPPFPKVGDRVLFVASVLNRGTGPTPATENLSVSFSVDGKRLASSPSLRSSIPAGGMALVSGSDGVAWPISNRTVSVRAEVDPDRAIEETIETNNQSTVTLSARPQ
jgi:beta-glucosidase